jgi:hypothetical protein
MDFDMYLIILIPSFLILAYGIPYFYGRYFGSMCPITDKLLEMMIKLTNEHKLIWSHRNIKDNNWYSTTVGEYLVRISKVQSSKKNPDSRNYYLRIDSDYLIFSGHANKTTYLINKLSKIVRDINEVKQKEESRIEKLKEKESLEPIKLSLISSLQTLEKGIINED